MVVPNVFVSSRPRAWRGWLRLVVAYRLPLMILVVSSTIIVLFVSFFLLARAEGLSLRYALQLAAEAGVSRNDEPPTRIAFRQACLAISQEVHQLTVWLTATLVPCCLLYVLLYVSFFRAIFTAPGFVAADGVWRGQPVVDPDRQSQLYQNWLSAQEVLQQTFKQRAACLAQQQAWRAYQRTRFLTSPSVPEVPVRSEASCAPQVAPPLVHADEPGALATRAEERTHAPADQRSAPPSPLPCRRSTWVCAIGGDAEASRRACTVPPDTVSNTHVVQEYEGNGAVRACVHCGVYKPDHGHHCRLCGRCVFYMDHHCVFLNTCVGLRNYKFFVLLLFYTLCCGFGNGLWLAWLVGRARLINAHLRHLAMYHKAFLAESSAASPLPSPAMCANTFSRAVGSAWWLGVPVAMFVIAAAVSNLLSYHIELCWRGESTLERKTSASVEALMALTGHATDSACACTDYPGRCCVCGLARTLYGVVTRRLRWRTASSSDWPAGQDGSEDNHDDSAASLLSDAAQSSEKDEDTVTTRRWARLGLLFGPEQHWWFHLLPLLPPHLTSEEWLAAQGIESLHTALFNNRESAQKLS